MEADEVALPNVPFEEHGAFLSELMIYLDGEVADLFLALDRISAKYGPAYARSVCEEAGAFLTKDTAC